MSKISFLIFLLNVQNIFANTRDIAVVPSEKTIVHPSAKADGLSRIDAEGNYIYDEKNELSNQSFHMRFGTVNNPDVSVEITQHNTNNVYVVTFDDMYQGASKLSLGLDYEYFFTRDMGKLGLQGGLAFQYAEGKGRLASDPTKESIETFSFITAPLFLGLVYRFEYVEHQYLAPYVTGGGAYTVLAEKRDDSSDIKAIGAFGYYASGGALFNLTAFSREMANDFRSEYGISNLWINLEFRMVQVSSDAFNYDNSFVQGGVSFDF